jgi:aryl-alcohol dehydrogenase-like predicted oxidoreductase
MGKVIFGDSGYLVSPFGLGLAALGRPGYINLGHAADLDHSYQVIKMTNATHQMLDEALNAGISYFDTAQSYGYAEDFLSDWLKNQDTHENDLFIATKWGYVYTALWKIEAKEHEVKEHSLVVLNRQWNLSRRRLSPNLNLFQIHSATLESGVLDNSRVLDRLAEIKDSGVLIGLSVSGSHQSDVVEKALKVTVEGRKLFDSLQITYNILEQEPQYAIQKAADGGLGIVIKEALANGFLTQKNIAPEYTILIDEMKSIANDRDVGIDAIGLAFVRQSCSCHVVLSGAATVEHLYSNLKARNIELTNNELLGLNKLKITSSEYWANRSKLKWN